MLYDRDAITSILIAMNILPSFLKSVCLTIVLSFLAPLFCISAGLMGFVMIRYIPTFEVIGQVGSDQIVKFLATFGSGNPWEGFLIIGFTCSVVGALFDTYVFYQTPRSH